MQVTSELDKYDYELPKQLIAQEPVENRTDARLMVVDRQTQRNFAPSCARSAGTAARRRLPGGERYAGGSGAAGRLSHSTQGALGRVVFVGRAQRRVADALQSAGQTGAGRNRFN